MSPDDGRTTSLYRNWTFQRTLSFSSAHQKGRANRFVRKRPITRGQRFQFHLNCRYRCHFSLYAAVCTSENYVFQTMFFLDFSVFASHSTFRANVQKKKSHKSNSYRENFVTLGLFHVQKLFCIRACLTFLRNILRIPTCVLSGVGR